MKSIELLSDSIEAESLKGSKVERNGGRLALRSARLLILGHWVLYERSTVSYTSCKYVTIGVVHSRKALLSDAGGAR